MKRLAPLAIVGVMAAGILVFARPPEACGKKTCPASSRRVPMNFARTQCPRTTVIYAVHLNVEDLDRAVSRMKYDLDNTGAYFGADSCGKYLSAFRGPQGDANTRVKTLGVWLPRSKRDQIKGMLAKYGQVQGVSRAGTRQGIPEHLGKRLGKIHAELVANEDIMDSFPAMESLGRATLSVSPMIEHFTATDGMEMYRIKIEETGSISVQFVGD